MQHSSPNWRPSPSPLHSNWVLDPEIVFLNHGSFGACPAVVLEEQLRLRHRMEAEPVRFFVRDLEEIAGQARAALGAFIGADPEGLALVNNATTGVNTVLASFPLGPGDEILITNHEYGACRNAAVAAADRSGAEVRTVHIPFPIASAADVTAAVCAGVTTRTRLLLIDHITSQTGLILPIEDIVAETKSMDLAVLVDGAHAPGMLDLNVAKLGADFYTGNCHKWLCTPKGAAFLWVRDEWRDRIRPLVISHGATAPVRKGGRFRVEFDWTGTDDPTAMCCIPTALRCLEAMVPGGWTEVWQRNHDLVCAARRELCSTLDIEPPCPETMLGSLASLPIADGSLQPPRSALYTDPLQDVLLKRFDIEVPIIPWPNPPRRLLRISAQLYNSLDQYRYLGDVLNRLSND